MLTGFLCTHAQAVAARMAAAAAALGGAHAADPQPLGDHPGPNPWHAASWVSAEGCVVPVNEDALEPRAVHGQPSEGSAVGLPLAPAAALLAAASAVAAEEASSADSRVRHCPDMIEFRFRFSL